MILHGGPQSALSFVFFTTAATYLSHTIAMAARRIKAHVGEQSDAANMPANSMYEWMCCCEMWSLVVIASEEIELRDNLNVSLFSYAFNLFGASCARLTFAALCSFMQCNIQRC